MLPLFDSQPPKFTEIMVNSLADGAVVVTANPRSARALTLSHADWQRAQGRTMWSSPAIIDWKSWLNQLWQEYLFSDPNAPLLLTHLQEHSLWMRVQQNDAHLVVWPHGLASLAQSAYERLSEYELHQERNAGWFETDAERLREWGKTFDKLCRERNWASPSNLEALLLHAIRVGALTLPKRVLLVGFDRFTPAQQTLLQHFRNTGILVEEAATTTSESQAPTLLVASDAHEELLICAEWCRSRLEKNPDIRIGVIAPDIRSIQAEADRTFRAVLMPQSLDIASESGSMPFEFSLGIPLSTVPVVRAALLLLHWIGASLDEADVSWLLLSGFFHLDSFESFDLAQLDAKRRDSGALSPETSLKSFIEQHKSHLFSKRMQRMLRAVEDHARNNTSTYATWTGLTEQVLQLAGWPGFRAVDGVQFQAQQRWLRLLDEIALLDFEGRKVTFSSFLQTLDRQAKETTFIPESHHAPIQILGALESSGQTFDAIWFLGVDDTQWPKAGRPHPLLPLTLQRQAKMPHCDIATDSELTLTITRRIAQCAQECIFSHSRQNKEGELRLSPILAVIFGDGVQTFSAAEFRRKLALPEPTHFHPQSESVVFSSQITQWPADRIAGGADVLKDQAACPFRAFGRRRLAAQPLNRTAWGLDAAQRGSLLHEILEGVWSPEMPESFRMITLDDLRNVIAADRLDEALRYQIRKAFEGIANKHAEDSWMHAYLESEQQRLLARLHEWMMYEAKRHPFTVDSREERLKDVNVGGLKLNLRADRIDKLPDGSHLLIDYKTGEVSASAWKGERPDEPQLPLYAVYGNVEHVSGLLFAQIRAGKMGFVGRAANAPQTLLSDLPSMSSLLSQPYDEKMHDEWQRALLQLAEEYLRGEASVDPKNAPDTCKYCPLPGLCRIAEAGPVSETDETDYA